MSGFFFLLADENNTAALISAEPPWGRRLTNVPPAGDFRMSDWHHLPRVLLPRLATHPARTTSLEQATCCVVASPCVASSGRGECSRGKGDALLRRLLALAEHQCPGRPLVVIDGPDADGANEALCTSLWQGDSCKLGFMDPLVRVTGNAPAIQSEVAIGGRRGLCRRLVVPYLSHARSASAAAYTGSRRPLRIAYAAAAWGHVDADAHGFVTWRKALRNACRAAATADSSSCEWVWVSMSGNGAELAISKYSNSDFCLQPPGDTLPRSGIIDALSVGCVPVLFHPLQAKLWRNHWNASSAALVVDWTGGAPRPRGRDPAAYADAATRLIQRLVQFPEADLRQLQRGAAAAVPSMIYALSANRPNVDLGADGANGRAPTHAHADAVDVLVEQMRALRLPPSAHEQAVYAQQMRDRDDMVEAQRDFERRRRKLRTHVRAGPK